MLRMAKWFNIGGPCNPADNYMLSATERLPEVLGIGPTLDILPVL